MEILLIEPPPMGKFGNLRIHGCIGTSKTEIIWPPLDLMMIAGYLRKIGIDSTVFDAHTLRSTDEEIRDLIKKERPCMLVFNTSLTTVYNDMKLAEIAKSVSGSILTVAHGANLKALPEETLRENPFLDVAIYSDPEPVVGDLAKANYNPVNIKGLCYRDNGVIKRNEPYPFMDLDEFGFPTHDKITIELYRDPLAKRRPMTIVMAQRGCINACTYCMATLYGKWRKRSVSHVIEELKWIVGLGFKEAMFFDCGLTNDLKWANELLDKMIENKIDLTWWCTARSDRLNSDILKKMKSAGCHSVGVGVESADPTIIRNVRKNIDHKEMKNVVSEVKKIGLNIVAYFMLGLPGETHKTIEKTLNFAKKLGTDMVTFGIATPHPGTGFYRYVEENNYLTTKDWSKYDPNLKPVYNYPQLSADEIYNASMKAYRSFYLRPSYMANRFLKIRSFLQIRNTFQNFLAFMRRYVMKS